MRYFFPALASMSNLMCGFVSMLLAATGNIRLAAWVVFISLLFDFLDGYFSRRLNSATPFGRELDSLADLVSFVVAPAFVSFSFFKELPHLVILPAIFVYLVCGTFRLARFNVEKPLEGYFEGLATPAAAIGLNSVVLASLKNDWSISLLPAGLLVFLGWMMASKMRYPNISSLPFSRWKALFYLEVSIPPATMIFYNIETAVMVGSSLFLFWPPIAKIFISKTK